MGLLIGQWARKRPTSDLSPQIECRMTRSAAGVELSALIDLSDAFHHING